MKKILVILVLTVCFYGLKAQNTAFLNDEKLTEFTQKLSKLPFSERDVINKACNLFEEYFKKDPENADWAYQILYFYHQITCDDKTETLHKTFSDEEIRALKIGDIKVLSKLRSAMKSFDKEYTRFGYRIMSFEDTSYAIEVQPDFLYKRLNKYLTKDYAYYRGLWIAEHDIPPYWHAALNVPLKEIMNRIEWRDLLLNEHSDFIRNDLVLREIEDLCFCVTKGLENTPIYDKKDIILPEYKRALQDYYTKHPETIWGLYFTDFIHKLALNKYRNSYDIDKWVIDTLFPQDRKNIDPIEKYKEIIIDNIVE
ncbi:MAG: hypothetical protein LBR28_01885 [Bacteroidales bacterium]|jgi:hypothetical protein|nr:hypothetical protein [Bacteroidales bacterium]